MAKGLSGIKTLKDFEFAGKNVFLRLDLNVPMENGKITDDRRITETLPTIRYILENGGKLMICSHLGRPKSKDDKKFSLEPVAKHLSELLNYEVILFEEPSSEALKLIMQTLRPKQVVMLENIRFEPGETEDALDLAQQLASNTEIYINDAFGASHRAHASIHALPQLVKLKGVGFLIEKEIRMLDQLLDSPKRPYWAILGGAKVSDKIDVIEKLIDLVDGFVIGGAMAYTFLKAIGEPVGRSLVEGDKVRYAKELLERIEARHKSVLLPVDHKVASSLNDTASQTQIVTRIPEDKMGLDIGPESLKRFTQALATAKTIFWNGPMGVFEKETFARGTFGIAQALADNDGVKIVGGGDSAAAADASGLAEKMTHISTGGGASLEYLQGAKLPGLEVLRVKIR